MNERLAPTHRAIPSPSRPPDVHVCVQAAWSPFLSYCSCWWLSCRSIPTTTMGVVRN